MTLNDAARCSAPWMTTLALGLAAAMACSSDDPEGHTIGDPNASAGGGGGGGAGAGAEPSNSGGSLFQDPIGSGGAGGGPIMDCAGEEATAEALPVDMYIMLDRSTSMADPLAEGGSSKWDGVVSAISGFVESDAAAGIGVGIQYFALAGDDECLVDAYATPAVEVGLLPGVASDIVASINAQSPQTFTPTRPALEGALKHMTAHAAANPERASVVVLASDGSPTTCPPTDITAIEEVARQAAEADPPVLTFVVGIAEGRANLNRIAAAGGTGKAFFIESGDVREQFLSAMLSIASTTLACEFDMPEDPEGMEVDLEKVLVRYTPNAGTPEDLVKVAGIAQCSLNGGEGWYFDPPTDPEKIRICPGTCSRFAAGSVRTVIGCKPPTFDPM